MELGDDREHQVVVPGKAGQVVDQARAEIGPLSQERAGDQRNQLIMTMSESRGEQLAVEQLPERAFDLGIERY